MANMSYCRFENTLRDLMDCLDVLEEEGMNAIESKWEREAAEDLVYTAKRFIEAYQAAKSDQGAEEMDLTS